MKTRKYIKTVIAILFAVAGSVTCFAQVKNDNITIVEECVNHQLNPQLTDLSSDMPVLSGIYEGLFSYNPVTLEPMYAIAIDYKIARDKKRWIFQINPYAKFSNGEKITAEHVRQSWLALLSNPQAPYAGLLDVIEGAAEYRTGKADADSVGIYVQADDKLMIRLCKPASYLPKILCHPAFSVINLENPTAFSGPYVFDQVITNPEVGKLQFTLKKNEEYWDKNNVAVQQITFIQNDDEEENAFLYNTGKADWVYANISTKRLIDRQDFLINAQYGTSFMFFKMQEDVQSVWAHLEFRQALFEAFPWELFRRNYYVPASTYVYPLTGYPEVEGYDFTDLIEAGRLMDAAREKYGIPKEVLVPLKVEISKGSLSTEQLLLMKSACDSLKIALQVKEIPVSQYLQGVETSTADLFIYTWIGDFADPAAFLELFRSDSTLNAANYKDPLFDELLLNAALSSGEESLKYYAQAETLLLDNCMVMPIQHPVTANVINTDLIGGWSMNAMDLHPLKYLYKKDVKIVPGNNVI
ncbi:MAG: ABC transporter substrate-binding protein [Treponema sp.]|nr:ABC transporter substrate-binding protein [Treponema sp.]